MWTCPNCNEQYEDHVETCRECASDEVVQNTSNRRDSVQINDNVSISKAFCTYVGMICMAMILSCPTPQGIVFAPMFPYGLEIWFVSKGKHVGEVLPVIGYLVYATLLLIFLSLRTKRVFKVAVCILAGVLIMNVAGCHKILKGFSNVT